MTEDQIFQFLVCLSPAFDASAAGLALGTRKLSGRAVFRIWFHFGFFQFIMALIGGLLGQSTLPFLGRYLNYIGFVLLSVISVKMFIDSVKKTDEYFSPECDPSRGWSLVTVAIATSLDSMGVGLSLAIAKTPLFSRCVLIGVLAAILTYIAVKIGGRLSEAWGPIVTKFGACLLFWVGVRLLFL